MENFAFSKNLVPKFWKSGKKSGHSNFLTFLEHEYKFILQNHIQHFDAKLKKKKNFPNKYLEKIGGIMGSKMTEY